MLTQPFKVEKQVWKGSDLTVSQNQAQEHSDNYLGPKKIKVIMSDSLWKIIIHAKKKKVGKSEPKRYENQRTETGSEIILVHK